VLDLVVYFCSVLFCFVLFSLVLFSFCLVFGGHMPGLAVSPYNKFDKHTHRRNE